MAFMCWGAGIMIFAIFGAGTPGGLIAISIIFGFFSGGYVSLLSPALISLANNYTEIGIRLGMAFLVTSFAALTGTPITGELLTRYGFYAPIVFSGVSVCIGATCITGARFLQASVKHSWKV
jgi:MFS family permease